MKVARKVITTALVAAGLLLAAGDSVFVTPNGKTFHSHSDCLALKRSTKVTSVTLAAATARGLRACGMCARRKGGK